MVAALSRGLCVHAVSLEIFLYAKYSGFLNFIPLLTLTFRSSTIMSIQHRSAHIHTTSHAHRCRAASSIIAGQRVPWRRGRERPVRHCARWHHGGALLIPLHSADDVINVAPESGWPAPTCGCEDSVIRRCPITAGPLGRGDPHYVVLASTPQHHRVRAKQLIKRSSAISMCLNRFYGSITDDAGPSILLLEYCHDQSLFSLLTSVLYFHVNCSHNTSHSCMPSSFSPSQTHGTTTTISPCTSA